MTATRDRDSVPDLFWTGEREVIWAVIALHREDQGRSLRQIARTVGCAHSYVTKVLRCYAAEPEAVEAELAAGDPRYLL